MSSSLPLSFSYLPSWPKSSTTPSEFNKNVFSFPILSKPTPLSLSKSHICFVFTNNSSEYEREETRWLREEQRWLREEQRWIREERRWEAERESLLDEIKALKLQIEELRHEEARSSVSNVTNLLHVLKKEVNQIAESGSSAAPLVVEAAAAAVEEAEEVVVKEVIRTTEEVKEKEVKEEVTKKRTTLRVGTEGDQVQMMQEALQKLGFYCGEEDEEFSVFSSGTERAVKTWQASIDVPETGMMTPELLERLYMGQKDGNSGFKEGGNGVAVTSVTPVPESPPRVVRDYKDSDHRVYLLGENRWEDSSRLTNRNNPDSQTQSQTNSKGVVTTRCITCGGQGRLTCEECDGTGEPNIEPQFLEWVGEDMKCPYCGGNGHISCDVCQGAGISVA
ncbi:hypothetical protein LXL04_004059 [Taraxacum kok-saghyz]